MMHERCTNHIIDKKGKVSLFWIIYTQKIPPLLPLTPPTFCKLTLQIGRHRHGILLTAAMGLSHCHCKKGKVSFCMCHVYSFTTLIPLTYPPTTLSKLPSKIGACAVWHVVCPATSESSWGMEVGTVICIWHLSVGLMIVPWTGWCLGYW